MVLRLFPLVAYLASATYLVSWLLRLFWALSLQGRAWWLQQKMASKVLFLKTWSRSGEGNRILISIAGALCGGAISFLLIQVFNKEWLLIILVVLALLSEDLRVSLKETWLLDVMVFFDRLLAQSDQSQDLFETLTKVIRELPEGKVQKSVREAVLRRRSGEGSEKSLEVMRGIDPFLDEFVLTLRLAGWQNESALNLILNRLSARAGRRWDRTSKILWIKDKSRPYVRFGQGALIAGLWVILTSYWSVLALVMPGRTVIIQSGLTLLCSGLVFYLIVSTQSLRRFLAVSIFILAFVSYANSLVIPMPSWIQAETISHRSDRVTDTGMAITLIPPVREEKIALIQQPTALGFPPTGDAAHPTSTPAPRVLPTITITPAALRSTSSIPEVFDPCCLRSHLPR